jgi:putative flippase GtrA
MYKLRQSRFSRYLLVGGSVYIFELGVIIIAQRHGANSTYAVGMSFWLGLLLSFGLQKFVTFKDKRMHKKILLPQILAVTTLVLFNFGFTILCIRLFSSNIPTVVTRTIALGATTIWNFYLYRTRIFKNDDSTLID